MTKLALALVVSVAACGGDIPADPTYFADVAPILRANCVRCHGAEPVDPKIARFRLDRYVKNDTATFDVYDYATGNNPDMIRVAVDHDAPAMPPDYSLTDRQRDILARWVEQGAPKGTRDNHPPRIALISPQGATTADQTLDLTYRAWDDDLDGLVVQLWAHDVATGADEDVPVTGAMGGGQHAASLDTGTLTSLHSYEIYGVLDDGFFDDPALNRTRATLIASIAIDHGARGTAPRVTMVTPNGGETLIGTATITWTASDPDPGDSVAIDLALMKVAPDGSETVAASIASGIANTGSYTWTIPSSLPASDATGAAIPYRVRVTGTDALGMPPNVRSDESDGTVAIAQATTTSYTWGDVQSIFSTYCGKCHGDPARTVAIDYFCLLEYKTGQAVPPCAASDEGVYEMRSTVYQRLVVQQSMPPATEPQPAQADIDKVGNWILGGAPFGSGPANKPPTFSWVLPSSTQTGSPVTLQWSAADAEGLASGKLESAHVNGSASSGCSATALTNAAWTAIGDAKASATLSGALTWADSFAWTPPATTLGYYCVRGSVTDTANQTVTVVNAYGIK